MKRLRWRMIAMWLFGLLAVPAVLGQVTSERMKSLKQQVKEIKDSADNLPESKRRALSSGMQILLQVAESLSRTGEGGGDFPAVDHLRDASPRQGLSQQTEESSVGGSGGIPVSDPSNDFAFSVLSGFTQSETSTAWCGDNVVVGFNDSGSFFESLVSGPGGLSFNGVARSSDRGASFRDLGFLNPGSNPPNFLLGDPVIGCADATTFFYASLFETVDVGRRLVSAVSVSRSSDGGMTFADPVVAASRPLSGRFADAAVLDKEWMGVDPTDPSRLFVTYTNFGLRIISCGLNPKGNPIPGQRIAIELIRSTDSGAHWSAPVIIDEVCSPLAVPGLFVQGSQVAVGPTGQVYVAWEFYDADFVTREIRFRKSLDRGVTFARFVKVDGVTCIGDCIAIQGGFRTFLDLQSLAVDRSAGPTRGIVYVAWHDGRNLQAPDLATPTGFYGYADVLVSRSTNAGASWSPPVRVNTEREPLPSGRGTDQYQPGIAVDRTGRVAACFYDRAEDRLNFFFDRTCAISENAGATFRHEQRIETRSSPFHAVDTFINPFYMGDYDSLGSDFTNANSGFVGAFQVIDRRGNPDVKAAKLE